MKQMEHTTDIIFENNLVAENRNINVYHGDSRGTHFLGLGGSVKVPLRTVKEKDFINLSVAVGPGYMERRNVIDLPSWLNYEFLSEGKFAAVHSENRTLLKIPAGFPEWKLKLTLSASHGRPAQDRVVISDDREITKE